MSKLQVDDIVNKEDNGSVGFSRGAVVTGVCTATSFSGPADTFTVETSGSERLRANSSGNVGINSTIPRSKLHVANGTSNFNTGNPTGLGAGAVASLESNTDVALQFLTSTSTDNFIYFGDTDSATTGSIQYDHNANALSFNVNGGTERLRIDSSGRLLIGTTTEGQVSADNFTVADSGNAGITIRSGTSGFGNLFFSDGTSGNDEFRGAVQYNHSTDTLTLKSNALDRVLIDSSGRLLIGTTTEGHANGDNLTLSDSGDCGLTIRSENSGEGVIYFSDGTSGAGEYAGQVSYVHSADALRFATAGTEHMRINSDGDVIMGGTNDATADFVFEKGARASFYRNLYFGAADSASANSQINANGTATFNGAVKIGGNAAANQIDEYEEGSWTPVPTFGGGNNGINGTFTGYYIRVGNLVNAFFRLTFLSKGTSTGSFSLSGQPFTITGVPRDGTSFSYIHRLNIQTVDAGDQLFGYMTGAPSMTLYVSGGTSTSNAAALTNADFANSTDLTGCTTYRIS